MVSSLVDRRHLFLWVVADLKYCAQSPVDYHRLRASALLRQLLIDEHALLDKMKRYAPNPPMFDVVEIPPFLKQMPGAQSIIACLAPSPNSKIATVRLSRDAFMNVTLQKVLNRSMNQVVITVRDVIQFAANVMGGVHGGSPRQSKKQSKQAKILAQQHMADIADRFILLGRHGLLDYIHQISQVVSAGLEPTCQAVTASLQDQPPSSPAGTPPT